MVRVSDWSIRLWNDVWFSDASSKYHDVCFYEQSALIRMLKSRGEGLNQVKPFHSYAQEKSKSGRANSSKDRNANRLEPSSNKSNVKLFAHVAVFTRSSFNTNIEDLNGVEAPQFIFHPA